MRPVGWPDWSGRTVVIAASGPGQSSGALVAARGRAVVVAINETWRLVPWADALYGCDRSWWNHRSPVCGEFRGMRISGERVGGCIWCGARPLWAGIEAGADPWGPMEWEAPRVGCGGSSAFQATNLAARCGAGRIVLTGVQCADPGHWHANHEAPLVRTTAAAVACWRRCWEASAAALLARVPVINASVGTVLRCFPQATLAAALDG